MPGECIGDLKRAHDPSQFCMVEMGLRGDHRGKNRERLSTDVIQHG
jgi:hypothetical protein